MKKYLLFFLFCMSLFFFSVSAAEVTLRAYINSGCTIRKGPGTNYEAINTAARSIGKGDYLLLVDASTYSDENNHTGCTKDWYKVYFKGEAGYVCGEHVEVVNSYRSDSVSPQTECENSMNNLGFPSSYWGGLCKIKEQHPNWQFVALKTGDDWANAVNEESACGHNLIYNSVENTLYIDSTCTAHDASYVGITTSGVAYYMDPRNFLSDVYIFQFLHLAYDDNYVTTYQNGVKSIIQGAAFYTYHANLGTDLGELINTAGKSANISPIFAASRMLQELGSSDSTLNLYSGVYTGDNNAYYGYYNFWNFGVSTSCNNQYGRTYCGLSYAKNYGWNSPYNAILGGMNQLSNNYISRNQYTGYLQKFNALGYEGVYNRYTHEYMTNVEAPSSEAKITYKTYNSLNILDTPFVFYIPVYNNMDATIDNSANGAVDDGGGTSLSTIPISTIVTSSGYKYSTKYISGISIGTEVSSLKSALESVGGNATVSITDASGNSVSSGLVGTGYKVIINNQSTTETLSAVIKGDTSGDGLVNALDLLQVQKNILGTYNLSTTAKEAGDTSSDGLVNALDLLQIQKSILGTYTIEQ